MDNIDIDINTKEQFRASFIKQVTELKLEEEE